MAGGGGADHRADVSTIRVLHDYRSEDDRSIQDGPMRGRVLRCPGRVCFEVGSSRLCSYFRIVFCWARGESDRSLVGSALANNRCHRGDLASWSVSARWLVSSLNHVSRTLGVGATSLLANHLLQSTSLEHV